MSDKCSNVRMPYKLRDQPAPIEHVILCLAMQLRDRRLTNFETQTRLSAASGISQSTWSKVENGLAEGVRFEVLARMAAVLHVDIVLRPCEHPPGFNRYPPNGRARRQQDAALIRGQRSALQGTDWGERSRR
jgi:transcriptional regulator with XRE-family HTH domain